MCTAREARYFRFYFLFFTEQEMGLAIQVGLESSRLSSSFLVFPSFSHHFLHFSIIILILFKTYKKIKLNKNLKITIITSIK